MLRVTLLSGEEVQVPVEELSDVKALKHRLYRQHGLPPPFKQRLLHEGNTLEDAVKLDSVMDLLAQGPGPEDLMYPHSHYLRQLKAASLHHAK